MPPPTQDDDERRKQQQAQVDLAQLNRVSHRLALTEPSHLPTVLSKLLPRLVTRVGDNQQKLSSRRAANNNSNHQNDSALLVGLLQEIHAKLMEMLSHTIKRVREDEQCRLPCVDLLKLLLIVPKDDDDNKINSNSNNSNEQQQQQQQSIQANSQVDPFTLHLTTTFLTLGIPRCHERSELLQLLPLLLPLLDQESQNSSSSSSNSKVVSRLVLLCLGKLMEVEQQQQTTTTTPRMTTAAPSTSTTLAGSKNNNHNTVLPFLRIDAQYAPCLYDLFLDAFLYRPSYTSLPSDGMSQQGMERLNEDNNNNGNSSSTTTSSSTLLKDRSKLQLALLDWIAPTLRHALFLNMNHSPNGSADNNNNHTRLGLERTLALLAVASGSSSVAPAVDQQATHYLKMYLDTAHRRQATSLNPASYGTVPLLNELMTLCMGQVQAEQLHEQLHINFPVLGTLSTDLSTKRRAVSVMTSTSLLRFCATAFQECNVLDQHDDGDGDDMTSNDPQILWISTLLEKVTRRILLQQEPLQPAGLSMTRAKPYVAAIDLLFAWVTRMTTYCDNVVGTEGSSSIQQQQHADLLIQAQSTVSSILNSYLLSASSSMHAAPATNNEGNHAIRDAAYGIYCIQFRSRTWQNHAAEMTLNSDSSSNNSLVKQLFQCTGKEDEKLRPRAVAALDALLSAYQQRIRILLATEATLQSIQEASKSNSPAENSIQQDNPWLQDAEKDDTSNSMEIDPKPNDLEASLRQLSNSLVPLIWAAAQSYLPKASRVAAARWASNLLMEVDMISACYVLCFLAGDADPTASSIAREGLGLSPVSSKTVAGTESLAFSSTTSTGAKPLPAFTEIVNVLFVSSPTVGDYSSNRLKRYGDFSIKGKAASLRFSQVCLMNDFYGGEDEAVLLYLQALCETLEMFDGRQASSGPSSIDLLDESSASLQSTLSASQFARRQFASKSSLCLSLKDLERLSLEANSSKARRLIAGSCGRIYEDRELWETPDESSLQSWLSRTKIEQSLNLCCAKLQSIRPGTNFVPALMHGSSFLGAHLVRAFRLRASLEPADKAEDAPAHVWQTVGQVMNLLSQGTLHADDVVGNSSCDGLGIALSYDGVDAPILDSNLFESCALSVSELSKALAKYSHGDNVDALRTMKLAKTAGICLAATTSGSGIVNSLNLTESSINLGPARFACASALLNILGSMSNRKEEEVALIVGEAIAAYADAYSPHGTEWSFSIDEYPSEYDDEVGGKLPPHQHVLFVLLTRTVKQSSPHVRTAAAPALLAVVARVARGINTESEYIDRALARELLSRLGVIQQVFIKLLSDPKSKHLSRESACLGLAACRGIAGSSNEEVSDELNTRLLRAFGQTTNHGGSAMIETQEQAAERRSTEGRGSNETPNDFMEAFGFETTEVGGAAGMNEATLGAYREMAGAAFALGRQDILYALLILSVSHPCWFSEDRRSAYSAIALLGESSFLGNGSGTQEMQEALRPHLTKLLPRILRACHDPNKQTREQMKSLYNGLTGGGAEARQAITQHLLSTIDTLIDNDANKLWRARVGACGALAEIIVGRDWQSLGGGGPVLDDDLDVKGYVPAGVRLLRLWRATIRSLDDVRGAVRDSAETLGRGVRALTIRLCDPMASEKSSGTKRAREEMLSLERDASAAAATALRYLVRHGLNQNCAEATGLCLSTLVEVVGIVRPTILEPILPDLLRSLLLAMSGLEPNALNYLQLRTTDQEGLERARLQMSQSGPLASAVNKLLEMLPKVAVCTQQAVVPELDTALRMSAGFATRAAVADSVASLCSTCPAAFEFPGASSGNPSVRLLRALYYASERERGPAAKDKMVHAVGVLAAVCPASSVRSLALRACDRYARSTGNNEDPTSRKSSAATIRAITLRASQHFSGGKRGDIFGTRILPVAYIGRKDADKKIASIWEEVWEEGKGSAIDVGEGENFGSRLEEMILPYLVTECIGALRDVSWARRVSGANALQDLSDLNVLAPIPRSTAMSQISTLEKKRAQSRAKASSSALYQCLEVLTKPRIWTGKADVMKAATSIASKWVGAEASPDKNEDLLYGWDDDSQSACPWKPILLSPSWNEDLFLSDSWFAASSGTDMAIDDTTNVASPQHEPATIETEVEDGEGINFDKCDVGLADTAPADTAQGDWDNSSSLQAPLTFVGFCKFALGQAVQKSQTVSDAYLPYKVAAFKGLASLLKSTPPQSFARPQIFTFLSSDLLRIAVDKPEYGDPAPPVAVAGSLDCLAACFWEGMGSESGLGSDIPIHGIDLVDRLLSCGIKQPAWTVREASSLCLAELATKLSSANLRHHRVVSDMMTCATNAQKDRKFWRVRLAGLKILESLAERAGKSTEKSDKERQLMLESILPFKEELIGILRKTLTDSEVKVTALATKVLTKVSWWP